MGGFTEIFACFQSNAGQSCSTACFSCKLAWSCRPPHATLLADFDFSIAADEYDPEDLKSPLLNLPPSSVGPPILHVMLGIVQNYVLNPLVALCNVLDYGEDLPDDLKDQKKMLRTLEQEESDYKARAKVLESSVRSIDLLIEVVKKTKNSGKKDRYIITLSILALFDAPLSKHGVPSFGFICM